MLHLLRPKGPYLYKELGGEALDHLLIIPPRSRKKLIQLYLISNTSIFIMYTSTSSYMVSEPDALCCPSWIEWIQESGNLKTLFYLLIERSS